MTDSMLTLSSRSSGSVSSLIVLLLEVHVPVLTFWSKTFSAFKDIFTMWELIEPEA